MLESETQSKCVLCITDVWAVKELAIACSINLFFPCSLRFAQEHREKIKFEDFHDLLHMFLPSLFALSQWFMVSFSGRARERFTKLILNVAGNAPNRIVIIAINTDLLLVCLSKQNVFPIISLDCMVCVC